MDVGNTVKCCSWQFRTSRRSSMTGSSVASTRGWSLGATRRFFFFSKFDLKSPEHNKLPLLRQNLFSEGLVPLNMVVVTFSSSARILGECSTIHSPPAFLLIFFFFKWTLARTHKFHSLGQDQSTVAQRTETTVTECSLTSCV